MELIYCGMASKASCRRVKRVRGLLVATDHFGFFNKLADLEKHLREQLSARYVIVLHVGGKKHLLALSKISELLMDHKVILILPEAEPEMVAMGHALRPRFITYNDGDFLEMAAVLRQLLFPHEVKNKRTVLRSSDERNDLKSYENTHR